MKREAALYLKVYEEIREASAAYCQQHDIHLLMRLSKGSGNEAGKAPQTREEILQDINRTFVFSDVPDITSAVLEILNARERPESPAKAEKSKPSDEKPAE